MLDKMKLMYYNGNKQGSGDYMSMPATFMGRRALERARQQILDEKIKEYMDLTGKSYDEVKRDLEEDASESQEDFIKNTLGLPRF